MDFSLEEKRFAVLEQDDLVWLLDQGRPFALYCRSQASLDQFRFRPEDPIPDGVPRPIPDYHMVSSLGVRTQFRPYPQEIGCREQVREQWNCGSDFLELNLIRSWPDKGELEHRFLVTAPQSGAEPYLLELRARVRLRQQRPLELFNLYLARLENDHPGFGQEGRCEYTVWRGRQGSLHRHRNSHPFCYLSVPTRRSKYLAEPGTESWIGFGHSPRFNPVWRVLQAWPRLASVDTCDMFFDQHLGVDAPGLEDRDEQGWFTAGMDVRLENLAPDRMRELVREARDVAYVNAPGPIRKAVSIGLEACSQLDRLVTSHEMPIRPMAIMPSRYTKAQALAFREAPGGGLWLCLDPEVPGESMFHHWEPRPTFPVGRLVTLLIRGEARGLEAPAWVGLRVTRFGHEDVVRESRSEPILQDGEWERRVSIHNGHHNFVQPFFHRESGGGLWLKSISLTSIEEPAPRDPDILSISQVKTKSEPESELKPVLKPELLNPV